MSNKALGIDFGTSFSCVAVYNNDRIEVIPVNNDKIMASCVSFTDDDTLVGSAAVLTGYWNSDNLIYGVKRCIGRSYTELENDSEKLPFKVSKNQQGKPVLKVRHKNEIREYTPEFIVSIILTRLKESAEQFLGESITKVVITVPAYFTNSQRQAIIQAGAIAGLEVLKIINEPTAAALAYGVYNLNSQNEKKVLVYDLGGGTFDVSIVSITKYKFDVLATEGERYLGGVDFDNKIIEYFENMPMYSYLKGLDSNGKFEFRKQCEQAKILLTENKSAKVFVKNILENTNFDENISQSTFNEQCDDLFHKTMELVKKLLIAANVEKSDIDVVVMVGGSTLIPRIQELVKNFFGNKVLIAQDINRQEAIACGAAIRATVLIDNTNNKWNDLQLLDVTANSLGIEVGEDSRFAVIIKKNTKIPCDKMEECTTFYDNQEYVKIQVLEGENKYAKDNLYLGDFSVENIEYAPAGIPRFEITFSLDDNAILRTKATDKKTNSSNNLTIVLDRKCLSSSEVAQCRAQLAAETKDQQRRSKTRAVRNKLEDYINRVQFYALGSCRTKLEEEEISFIGDYCNTLKSWMEDNKDADENKIIENNDLAVCILGEFVEKMEIEDFVLCNE